MNDDSLQDIKTYRMGDRSDRLDFDIRDQSVRPAIAVAHRHEFFQMQVNTSVGHTHVIGGQRREHPSRSIIFVMPYRVHCAYNPPDARYHIINFAPQFLRPGLDLSPFEMEEASIFEYPELAPFLYEGHVDFDFGEAEFAYVQGVIRHMMTLNQRRGLGTLERLRGMLLELIGFVTETYQDALREMAEQRVFLQRRSDTFKRVMRHIEGNLAAPLSIYSVAEAAHVSPNYLSQLLKKHTGLAFVEWVTAQRMERAKYLLAHGEDRVGEIAKSVGFADEAYFTRRFTQRFGQSPSKFRRQMQVQTSAEQA
ncbi:AraC family transcriptional regulator [Caballeronia hypogeia]|uniref:AraC family transcriptional regulator n=1 Tax=Caballeronia hypogeia TaxID=1777140 RepID=A0A157ZKH1_9BURK|nr:AraC family transcriptional regulator [Caballeronia hypogeia]SAK46034.1 AraC family transcriptional regulator [Caballeronia hypogeia]